MWTFVGQAEAGRLEHGRPEQRVEVGDVLADEVVDLGLAGCATSRRTSRRAARTTAASSRCSRSARRTRRTSSCPGCRESRSRSTAPAARRPNRAAARRGSGPSGSWRPRAAGARRACVHSFEKAVQLSRCSTNRWSAVRISGFAAGERAHRVDQVGRAVVAAALVAAVAVLVGRLALRAGALDEAIGQERAGLRRRRAASTSCSSTSPALRSDGPNLVAELAVLRAVGAAVVVELDVEAGEVAPRGPAASRRSAPPR